MNNYPEKYDKPECGGESPADMPMREVRRRTGITTDRRRQLLALSIEIVDRVLSKSEKHERRLLFRMIETQFADLER